MQLKQFNIIAGILTANLFDIGKITTNFLKIN